MKLLVGLLGVLLLASCAAVDMTFVQDDKGFEVTSLKIDGNSNVTLTKEGLTVATRDTKE